MGVQNGYNATRLFLFSGKESITASEFKGVDDFRQLVAASVTQQEQQLKGIEDDMQSFVSTKDQATKELRAGLDKKKTMYGSGIKALDDLANELDGKSQTSLGSLHFQVSHLRKSYCTFLQDLGMRLKVAFKTITNLGVEEVGQFGQVIACDDLDCFDKNGKPGKKKPLTLLDAEGTEMRCTLWGAFVQQFSDFLQECDDHSNIIAVLHLAMMKM
ncbi:Kinesin, motor domain-containing protein [Artemisia annua]|uniref:Kinesin, motor domain-containing protein n=1 Tax=Artemisia annua TaxID=35608 RepID=A0A2U1LU07_ARTAN|nr:Kinesin, motor domain-containing protein [Artemisia annua]